MPPGPRPGTLEWLTDQRPDEAVLLTPDGAVTRAEWEARAGALAEHLAHDRGVGPRDLITAGGRIGPPWFTVSWAAAKLGAGLAGLPPGPGAAPRGTTHVDGSAGVPAGASRRLSGAAALPDAVTFSRSGRPVRRSFTPESAAAIAATLADLVARLRAAPGTTLVLSGPVSDPILTFLANVVLVGGGRVLSAPEPAAALAAAARHDADLAALAVSELDALTRLGDEALEALDVTTIEAVVTGGAPIGTAARAVLDDLFGAEAVIDVYATADTGVVAVRGRGDDRHALLEGVGARTTPGGLLEVRSPLAAAPGWVATGDRAALVGGAELELN